MTKIILATAIAAITFAACNDAKTENETVENTTITPTDGNTAAIYTPADGDVMYTNNKVMVMRNGQWVESEDEVRLDNGTIVHKNGIVRKDDKEVELREGEIVNRMGNFFDRSGRAIENAWDATKEGAKDAGRAIENAVDNDKKNRQ